jgi:hypothetical protein
MFEYISKQISDIKILHEGYTSDYFLNRMKPNALFPILLIKKKNQVPTFFYQIIAHVHFREILSGYFLFSRFDWSIFVTQLVAKHMKEIIYHIIFAFKVVTNKAKISCCLIDSKTSSIFLGYLLFLGRKLIYWCSIRKLGESFRPLTHVAEK